MKLNPTLCAILLALTTNCQIPSKYDIQLINTIHDQAKVHAEDMMKLNEELIKIQLQFFLIKQGFSYQTPFKLNVAEAID
jgi:hypothetical protein